MQGLLAFRATIQTPGQFFAAIGRAIRFVDLSPEAMRAAVLGLGMPVWQADGLVEDYAHYRRREAQAVERGVSPATGRPPRSLADFARDYAAAFA